MASILGGVMMPHAPQFFTLPDTEDKATVERVRLKAGEIGRALARGLGALGAKAVVVASGGMSHFPGTEQYSEPDVTWDRALFETLKTGNLRALLAYGADELDRRGNVELRSWAIAAGMIGE